MQIIFEINNKQYIVNNISERIKINYIKNKKKNEILEIKKILFIKNKEKIKIGLPYIKGIKINAIITKQKNKKKKITVYKKNRRKGFSKKKGFRELYTEIKIKELLKY